MSPQMLKSGIKKSLKHSQLLKVGLTITPKNQLLKKVKNELEKNVQLSIFTPNPEILVMSSRNSSFRKILNNSDINIVDGVGTQLGLSINRGVSAERITGREFFIDLLKIANEKSLKIFLLGATKEVNASAISKIKKQFPNIKVKGDSKIDIDLNIKKHFDINSIIKDNSEILNSIKTYKPDMLFVALGAPKQEILINAFLPKTDIKLAIGIGGTLDSYTSKVSLPPNIFSKYGLEWLWRLYKEPKRVGRIINAIVVFPLLVLLDNIDN